MHFLSMLINERLLRWNQTLSKWKQCCPWNGKLGLDSASHSFSNYLLIVYWFSGTARNSDTYQSHDLGMLFNMLILNSVFAVPNCPPVHGSLRVSEPMMHSFLQRCVSSFATVTHLKSKHRHSPQGHFLLVNLSFKLPSTSYKHMEGGSRRKEG